MHATQYNDDFAWTHGFGGGLIEGLRPDSEVFVQWTKTFQTKHRLTVDGYFGPKCLAKWTELHGPPSLQVLGVDVSGWQDHDELDWQALAEAGRLFAGIKVVQGTGGEAKACRQHTRGARAARLIDVFHYGFCTPWTGFADDSVAEAERFFEMLSRYQSDTIIGAADFEDKGYKQRKDSAGRKTDGCEYGQEMYDLWRGRRGGGRVEYVQRMTGWIERYLHRFVELYGRTPILYSYPSFLRDRIDLGTVDSILFECPLWLASHTLGDPMKRHHMDARFDLVIHQYSSSGDEQTRAFFDHGLDLNRAPYGLSKVMR